jgi:hypothetical protein
MGSNVYQSSWWSVELPSGWLGRDDDECVTFVRVDGVGALQISAYGSGNTEVTDDDLEEFSHDDMKEDLGAERVSYGQFVRLGICERAVAGYWRKYWLRARSVLLFVTYTSNIESAGIEDCDVDRILDSLAVSESVFQSERYIT